MSTELATVKQAPARAKSRVAANCMVYFQEGGSGPEQFDLQPFSRWLETADELPYRLPRGKVTQEWLKLECGWIDGCGLLVLRNDEGQDLQVNPPWDEADRIAGCVIQVGVKVGDVIVPMWRVRSGEWSVLEPDDCKNLWLRNLGSGEAKYAAVFCPR